MDGPEPTLAICSTRLLMNMHREPVAPNALHDLLVQFFKVGQLHNVTLDGCAKLASHNVVRHWDPVLLIFDNRDDIDL